MYRAVNVILGVSDYATNLGLPLADVDDQIFIPEPHSSSIADTVYFIGRDGSFSLE